MRKKSKPRGISIENLRAQRHYSKNMTATAQPPSTTPPRPPRYTLWVEGQDDIGPDVVATASALPEAIAKAARYAQEIEDLVLLLETETGRGWAIQAIQSKKPVTSAITLR